MRITIEFDARRVRRAVHVGGALLLAVAVAVPVLVYASVVSVTVPNSFTAGTTISSSQVNANFAAVQNAVNTLGANVGDVALLQGPSTNLVSALNVALVASQVRTAASAPSGAQAGNVYYDTTAGAFLYFDGVAFNRVQRKLPRTFMSTNANETAVLGAVDYVSPNRVLNFTKASGTTLVKITYADSLGGFANSNPNVRFVVQVDGVDQIVNTVASGSSATGQSATSPSVMFGVVSGLVAGLHTVSVHARNSGNTAYLQGQATILVEEFDP